MDINKGRQAASLFQHFAQRLADKLSPKTKTYFLPLILGALLAIARRRTVTTWIRAAQISDQYRQAFYHIPNVGRKSEILFDEMIDILIEKLGPALEWAQRIRFVLDDSPTKRYGPKIEGANYHHNPTPDKTNAKHCYGHSWVVAVLVVTHPLWGEISFPISAKLYLRQDDIEKLDAKYKRKFQTKTSMGTTRFAVPLMRTAATFCVANYWRRNLTRF